MYAVVGPKKNYKDCNKQLDQQSFIKDDAKAAGKSGKCGKMQIYKQKLLH